MITQAKLRRKSITQSQHLKPRPRKQWKTLTHQNDQALRKDRTTFNSMLG